MIPFLVGGFGPSIAGIIIVYRTQGREGRGEFWRRRAATSGKTIEHRKEENSV